MKLTWLGQAGYVITTRGGTRIMIDPYLSDNLYNTKGEKFTRCVPIDESWLHNDIDVLVFSHNHDDHTDPVSVSKILDRDKPVTVLAPMNNWDVLRHTYDAKHNYLMFDAGIEITIGDALIRSVPAAHSDVSGIGIIIDDGEKSVYHTGDTMFRRDLPSNIDCVLTAMIFPINGVGNNMNARDAKRFADIVKPDKVFPMHWDMFKAFGCDVGEFCALCDQAPYEVVIPKWYEEIEL